jgi:hypothetical protein
VSVKCIALSPKVYYTYLVRIEILPSARKHGILDAEIRAVISYPEIRVGLVARFENAYPVLFIGRAADNNPHIEVIADVGAYEQAEVFHAMMLRPATVKNLDLEQFIKPNYGPQRPTPEGSHS